MKNNEEQDERLKEIQQVKDITRMPGWHLIVKKLQDRINLISNIRNLNEATINEVDIKSNIKAINIVETWLSEIFGEEEIKQILEYQKELSDNDTIGGY